MPRNNSKQRKEARKKAVQNRKDWILPETRLLYAIFGGKPAFTREEVEQNAKTEYGGGPS